MCMLPGNFDSLSGNYAPYEQKNLSKIKYTVCQCNFSETAQQNFMELCSYEGHNGMMCIYRGISYLIFFPGNYAPFELRRLSKIRYTTETVCQHNSSENAQQSCI